MIYFKNIWINVICIKKTQESFSAKILKRKSRHHQSSDEEEDDDEEKEINRAKKISLGDVDEDSSSSSAISNVQTQNSSNSNESHFNVVIKGQHRKAKSLAEADIDAMDKFHATLMKQGVKYSHVSSYEDESYGIDYLFHERDVDNTYKDGDWRQMDHESFFKKLKNCTTQDKLVCQFSATAEAVQSILFDAGGFDDKSVVTEYIKEIYDALAKQGALNRVDQTIKLEINQEEALCKQLWKKLPTSSKKDRKFKQKVNIAHDNGKFTTLKHYFTVLLKCFSEVVKGIATSISLGIISSSSDSSPEKKHENDKTRRQSNAGVTSEDSHRKGKDRGNRPRFPKRDRDESPPDSTDEDVTLEVVHPKKDRKEDQSAKSAKIDACDGCGIPGHLKGGCIHKKHPGFNNSKHSWAASLNGKKYAENGHKMIKLYLMPDRQRCKWNQRPSADRNAQKKTSTNDKGTINLLHLCPPEPIHYQTVLGICESLSAIKCASEHERLIPIDNDNLITNKSLQLTTKTII